MRNSPLRLKELFFPKVAVAARVPANPESVSREIEIDDLDIRFGLDINKDGNQASAGLKIISKADSADNASFYDIEIEAFANFEVHALEHQDAMAVYLRKFAAAAALIGAAREQVALMTSRGPWGVVMLPIISMDRVVGPPPDKEVPQMAAAKIVKSKARTKSSKT